MTQAILDKVENARANAWNAQAVVQQLKRRIDALEQDNAELRQYAVDLDARLQAVEAVLQGG